MVKFKKLLEEKTKENNSKYTYINYKKLKRIINETYIKLRITKNSVIDIKPNKSLFSNFFSFFTIKRLNDGEYSSKISDLQYFIKNSLIKDFFIELNKEINSLYKFYSREEISISNELNHIFITKKFDIKTESLISILDDSQKLYVTSLQLKLLYECLILNFEAIRKICKKFDKKLNNFLNKNSICVFYLKSLIDYHNSDLSYLLKMQIIEQGLILLQNRVAYLLDRKNNLLKDPQKKNKLTNLDYHGELTEADLIQEIDGNLEKTNDIIEGMITNEKYTITNLNLGLILKYDDTGYNQDNYKPIDNEDKVNGYVIDYDNEHINALLKKEEMLSITRMFINKEVYQKIIYIFFYYLNDLNYTNILLLFFHLFLNYFIIGTSLMQIIIILLFTEEAKIKYYGISVALIYLSQFIANKFLSKKKFSSFKLKYLISLSLSSIIILQFSYIYLINLIENENWNSLYILIWIILFSILIGICTGSKLSMKYLVSCVPKNTLIMMSKNLSLFKGIFLYSGIMLFFLFNQYISYFIIILFIIMNMLFLKFFTEKNSEKFYKYKTNFNELSEKIQFFNNSGELIEKSKSLLYNDNVFAFERNLVRESVMIEELQMEQKIQLEKANQEFNEINQKSNFNISNVVPDKTKFILKNLSDKTKKIRYIFLFLFQFLSCFYRQGFIIITLINYIKQADVNRDKNEDIQDIYLFKITFYDILLIISLPLGYLLYKTFNRYNDIHSIFRFYFIINSVILFMYTFTYDSPYLLLFFNIYISFNYVMDNKINVFFAINYRNEITPFKLKVNEMVNLAYYLGKIFGSFCLFFLFNKEYYFLFFGSIIYFGASFYDRIIKLSKIIILGRSYSKEIN